MKCKLSKLLVSNICRIEFIVYITKFTTVNILGGILYQEIKQQPAHIRFQLILAKYK